MVRNKIVIMLLICLVIFIKQGIAQPFNAYSKPVVADPKELHWSDGAILGTGLVVTVTSVTYVSHNIDQYSQAQMNKVAIGCIAGTLVTYTLNYHIRNNIKGKGVKYYRKKRYKKHCRL